MPKTPQPASGILLYRSEDGRTRLHVRLENETVWLNQRQLTELFRKAKGTISEHIKAHLRGRGAGRVLSCSAFANNCN